MRDSLAGPTLGRPQGSIPAKHNLLAASLRFNSNGYEDTRKSSLPSKLNIMSKQRKSMLNQSYTADSKASIRTKKKKLNFTTELQRP
jgi:hypothetical protein